MDILEKIVEYKRKEVADRKSLFPVKLLEQSIFFETAPVSMKKYIQREDLTGSSLSSNGSRLRRE
jgi:indole-3-glycerol phosphate synthase